MLSQRLAKDAREAVYGQEGAFPTLKSSREQFDTIINSLDKGNPKLDIPPSPQAVRDPSRRSPDRWKSMRTNVDQILSQEKSMIVLRDHVVGINQASPLLLALSDEVVEAGAGAGMKPDLLYLAGRQGMLSQRIAKDVNLFAQGGAEAAVAAAQFGKDAKLFKETNARLRERVPPSVRAKLDEASEIFGELNTHVEGILAIAAELFVSQRAEPAGVRAVRSDARRFAQTGRRLYRAQRPAPDHPVHHADDRNPGGRVPRHGGLQAVQRPARARQGERRSEPPDAGRDSQAARRNGQPRRRRPEHSAGGHRADHRCDRRLDQLRREGDAQPGHAHQGRRRNRWRWRANARGRPRTSSPRRPPARRRRSPRPPTACATSPSRWARCPRPPSRSAEVGAGLGGDRASAARWRCRTRSAAWTRCASRSRRPRNESSVSANPRSRSVKSWS
ncbi:MAG: type IV pili methyl-accepting chemotaxis transducer N-terminal domain-containing protein [Chromatiales bacterium]|nr:type IV pili methyl-accepting chemotaxis transducer N-terminal domain-containing protein [Chromatiales bacterium]